jgi:hypothetical protein
LQCLLSAPKLTVVDSLKVGGDADQEISVIGWLLIDLSTPEKLFFC